MLSYYVSTRFLPSFLNFNVKKTYEHKLKQFNKDSKKNFGFLNVDATGEILSQIMNKILSQIDKLENIEDIASTVLLSDIIDFEKQEIQFKESICRLSKIDKYSEEEQVNDLMKCIIFLVEKIDHALKEKYSNGMLILSSEIKQLLSVLCGIYMPNYGDCAHECSNFSPELLLLTKNLMYKIFKEFKYFNLLKLFVSCYDKKKRKNILYLIKSLFNYLPTTKKDLFLSAIGHSDGKVTDHVCTIMLGCILQTLITDTIVILNSAIGELGDASIQVQKNISSLSGHLAHVPVFPVTFSFNQNQ